MAVRLILLAKRLRLYSRLDVVKTATITTYKRLYTNKNLLRLGERNLLEDVYPGANTELQTLLSKEVCIYAGFDPTADSLHVGNLLVLMVLLHAHRAGHNVLAVVGGATAMIGDPSGKTTERKSMKFEKVESNIAGIKSNINNLFNNHQQHFWTSSNEEKPLLPIRILDNMSWYSKMTVVDFLSTFGKHFRMGTMLLKQSVQSRINSHEGMSFAEFSYQTFQAHDWLYLYNKYQCMFQVGGIDQKGNVSAGHELISRVKNVQCYGLFVPLAKSDTGSKIGKSVEGVPIWLDPKKTSPFEFYQYFLQLPDASVEAYLKWYTFLSVAEIKAMMEKHMSEPELRKAQKKLAELVTLLVHGDKGLESAKKTTNVLYHGTPDLLASLSEIEIQQVFEQAPSVNLILQPGTTILQMVLQSKLASSEEAVRRLIKGGGLTINYRKVDNPDYVLVLGEHILPNNHTLIRTGKKNYFLVRWIQ